MLKKLSFILLILPIIFIFPACAPDNTDSPEETADESITFVLKTVSNGNSVGGVTLTYEGNTLVTDAAGSVSLTVDPDETTGDLPQTVAVTASKKFFVTSETVFNTADYASRSTVSEEIEISPRIFMHELGSGGIGRITAVDDMIGTNRVSLSTIPGYETDSYESGESGDPDRFGSLDGPTAINVDYDNGIIYIFDTEGFGDDPYAGSDAVLIRLTDFPESSSDSISSSAVDVFALEYSAEQYITAVAQAVITGDDELLVLCGEEFNNAELYRLSGMSTGTISIEQSAADLDEGIPTYMASGLAVLPDDSILILSDMMNQSEDLLLLDDFGTDNTTEDFMSYAAPSPGDTDYFAHAYRLFTDLTGRWLFIGDIYNSYWYDGETDDSRIARFDLDSSSANLDRSNFGSEGSGTNQFSEPVLLAVLPDNRLYIEDVGNQRLVRVDLSGSTIQDWAAYKPSDDLATADVDESFDFGYFFNGC